MSKPTGASRLTRRRLLIGGAGALLVGLLAGRKLLPGDSSPETAVEVRAARPDLPAEQHRWTRVLAGDGYGGFVMPRHHRLVMLSLEGAPTVAAAASLEDSLRGIEWALPPKPTGVLTVIGWGPAWFTAIDAPSPVPEPSALTPDEAPDLDSFVSCIHLASDIPGNLDLAEQRLRDGMKKPLVIAETRNGFIGRGIPQRYGGKVNGIPAGQPPEDAPMFMGFPSGLRNNQPLESDVVIDSGPWSGSTTMHVATMPLALGTWFGSLTEKQRAERMFWPEVSTREAKFPRAGKTPPGDITEQAREFGFIGHAQAVAAARVNGRPRILRRDFDGLDGDQPVVHFVSLQKTIEDFAITQRAMAADSAVAADEGITPHVNNGINEWVSTSTRANYLVPPRKRRVCPGLADWDSRA